MSSDLSKQPAHMLVYQGIRAMILCGDLAPGQPVTIQGLTDTIGAGMTPVREAIRRLTSEGALEFQGNRRVCVPVLTTERVDEIAFARYALEPQLALWASEKITPGDIYKLDMIDRALDAALSAGDVREYLMQNFRFHMALYECAEKDILMPLVEALWLRISPSLRIMCGRVGTRNLPDMHRETLDALRRGDGPEVARAIHADIAQGLENVRRSISDAA